jgi:hypothetical protein
MAVLAKGRVQEAIVTDVERIDAVLVKMTIPLPQVSQSALRCALGLARRATPDNVISLKGRRQT